MELAGRHRMQSAIGQRVEALSTLDEPPTANLSRRSELLASTSHPICGGREVRAGGIRTGSRDHRAPGGGMLALGAVVVLTLAGVQGGEVAESQPPAAVRRCYWCGPLAERVHRSERAEPCGPDARRAPCDSAHQYCATVASAPPYAESRLCVNKYHESCVPTFCNTTRVWKVVCPCHGDLCNDPGSREAALALHALDLSHAKSRVERDAASLRDHSHDTDLVNQLTTITPAVSTDKPTGTGAGDKLVPHVESAAVQVSKSGDIAKEGDVGSDKDLASGTSRQRDDPSRKHEENAPGKEAETAAAAMPAAADPHQPRQPEHAAADTHQPQRAAVATHSSQADEPHNLTALGNQTARGADTPKNNAPKWGFDVLFIISINISLLLYNNYV